jgi:single-strand DNA-binding protein
MQSTVTLVGNLVSDVTVRQTSGGLVANFRIAADNGYFDRRNQQWVEKTTYLSVSAWRALGENVAQSLAKGQPVVVVGKPRQREFDRDGQRVTVVEIDADLVGHDLNRGASSFERTRRGPQTSELLREVEAAGRRPVEVPDTLPADWAVPGVPTGPDVGAAPAA